MDIISQTYVEQEAFSLRHNRCQHLSSVERFCKIKVKNVYNV